MLPLMLLWVALAIGAAAFSVALLAYREASRSSARNLRRTVHEAIEGQDAAIRRLQSEWLEHYERSVKAYRKSAASAKRLEELMAASEEPADAPDDGEQLRFEHGDGRHFPGVHPMRPRVDPGSWLGGRTG
jgi:Flp pilus assembly protein TadB